MSKRLSITLTIIFKLVMGGYLFFHIFMSSNYQYTNYYFLWLTGCVYIGYLQGGSHVQKK